MFHASSTLLAPDDDSSVSTSICQMGGTTPAVTWVYDTLGAGLNGKGRLTSVSSSVSSYSYGSYDAMGRVLTGTQTTTGNNYSMSYQYNLSGSMTSETYPSGRVVATEYDSADRIAGVRNQGAGWYYAGATPNDSTNRIQYTAHGAMSAMKLGSGKWEHTNFNPRLQPTQIGLGTSSTDSSVVKLDYTFNTPGQPNNNGNVLTQIITIGSTAMTQTYGYDWLNRLSSATETGAASWSQIYDYDRYGNRAVRNTSYIPQPSLTPQSAFQGDLSSFSANTNRIVLSGFGYDVAGNLTGDPSTGANNIVYDAENRQISYTKAGTTTTYSYDGDGHRVKKIVGTTTTIFVYNAGGQLIAEYTTPDVYSTNGLSYLTNDHLGSTRVVTDINGNEKSRRDYLPFGEEIGTDHCPGGLSYGEVDGVRQKFTQQERDSESGLDYFLARYYSSAQGRFTSVDPSMFSGRAIQPQSWNRYTYTINNPLRYTDPTGLDWWYDPDAATAKPTWFDSDPGGKWKRWTDTYSYVYQPVDAGGLWVTLNPNGPQAFLTDTQDRAQAQAEAWAGSGLFSGTPAQRDWLAGFNEGLSPVGPVTGWFNGLQGADTTSREYQGGVNTGILASTIALGGAGVIRTVTASSNSVRVAQRALAKGATEVHVKSAEEAAEVYLHTYQGGRGPGYRNTTGMTGKEVRNDTILFPKGKRGTYHWDLQDTQHGGTPHLQVHTQDGRTVRIFFPIGK